MLLLSGFLWYWGTSANYISKHCWGDGGAVTWSSLRLFKWHKIKGNKPQHMNSKENPTSFFLFFCLVWFYWVVFGFFTGFSFRQNFLSKDKGSELMAGRKGWLIIYFSIFWKLIDLFPCNLTPRLMLTIFFWFTSGILWGINECLYANIAQNFQCTKFVSCFLIILNVAWCLLNTLFSSFICCKCEEKCL